MTKEKRNKKKPDSSESKKFGPKPLEYSPSPSLPFLKSFPVLKRRASDRLGEWY